MSHNWQVVQKKVNVYNTVKDYKRACMSNWWYILYALPTGFIWYASFPVISGFTAVLPVFSLLVLPVIFYIHLTVKNSSFREIKKAVNKDTKKTFNFKKAWSIFVFISGLITQIILVVLQLSLLGFIQNNLFVTALPFSLTIGITVIAVTIAVKSNK